MSTIDPSQLTAADLSNPALSAQDLADITAARPDLRPYVATHPSLYPALGQWLADQGVVPAQPPAAEEPAVTESEAPAEDAGEQAEPFAGVHEEAQPEADAAPADAPVEQPVVEESHGEAPAEPEAVHVEPEAPVAEASDDNLEQAILEGAEQSEASAGDEATPALSTEEQVAQSPFSNPPQADAQPQGQPQVGAQPQQGQQAPFGQPGQPQYGTAPQQGQQGQPQYGTAPQQGQQGQRPQQAPFGQPGQSQFGGQPQQGQQAPFGQPGQQGQQQFGGQPQQGQQAPFGQPGQQGQQQFGAQPQQGQQAPFGQPGQPQPGQQQYGQPGYAPAGQSTGQQFGAAAQQFGAAANSAFNQFQTAVVAETGKVSGRSVRATYSLIGIAASAVLILVSMFLPFVSAYGYSASMFEAKGGYSAFHLIMLMAVVGLGAAYWFTNQKWAYLSAGIGALVVALLGVIQFIVAISNKYVDASFGAFMLLLFSLALGAAGGLLLMELKAGAVAPINNPNAFGGAFAGAQMGQQQGQFGQQQGGFQAPQAGQPQFGQQRGGFQAPQAGQPQFGQQQGGFQAPQAGQQQFGQQAQFGQQQGQQQPQQPQLGDKPYNPFGPQA